VIVIVIVSAIYVKYTMLSLKLLFTFELLLQNTKTIQPINEALTKMPTHVAIFHPVKY